MGTFQRGKIWWVDYRADGRRIREPVGTSKKLADAVLAKRLVAVAENRHLDVKRDEKIKFIAFAETFLDLHSKVNKRSWERDAGLLKNLCAVFGDKLLSEIKPLDIEAYKQQRAQKVSVATTNRELACLKCLYNRAIEWGKVSENPMRHVKLFRENNTRLRFLEIDEMHRLLDACSDTLRPVVFMGLHTGMRCNEILGLKWRDIDIAREIIYLHDTKNGEKREVPMSEPVKQLFFSIRRNPAHEFVFCSSRSGNPYKSVRTAFENAVKAAGLNDFHFHDLRHTFASHLVMAGVDLKTVQELLGHKAYVMTLRYAHLSPSHKKRAADTLGKKLVTIWSQPRTNPDTKSKADLSQDIELQAVN